MTIKTCDRCGKMMCIPDEHTHTCILPRYKIFKKSNSVTFGDIIIDLCRDCENDFDVWLKNVKEGEGE